MTQLMNVSNIIHYTPVFIQELSESITTLLDEDIINNLLEIKNNNKFIRRKSPIKLRYVMENSLANVWRNQKEKEGEQISMETYIEKLNSYLNKVSDRNFDAILTDIIDYVKLNIERDWMKTTLYTIFNKCILESLYSSLYAKLLKRLMDIYGEEFKELILEKTEDFYENNITKVFYIENNVDISYSDLCDRNKEKSKLLGSFSLIGGLYEQDIIHYDIVLKYFNVLLDSSLENGGDSTSVEKYIECLLALVEKVGLILEKELKGDFDTLVIDKLSQITKNKSFKPRVRFLVMDLFDLRNNQWKK